MKKFVSNVLIASLLASFVTTARVSVCEEKRVDAYVHAMRKFEVAPFDGVLMNPAALAVIMAEKRIALERSALEIDRCRKEERAKCDFSVKGVETKCSVIERTKDEQLAIQAERNKKLVEDLSRERAAATAERSSKYWWLGGGFIGGAATIALSIFAVGRITK